MLYSRFKANLITFSTGRVGSSFRMADTTFCEGACGNPNMVSAATASSCTSEWVAEANSTSPPV